jgi:prepilin-type N-terminal cleavage/methylation domain-containing protein
MLRNLFFRDCGKKGIILPQSGAGFTLIELIVAIGIFSVVTAIAMGGFVNVLRTERQAAALLSANSNISLIIEQMAREIRTGDNFCVSGYYCLCSLGSCSSLQFRNAENETVTYRADGAGAIERGAGSQFQKITAQNVNVRYLNFIISGQNPGDGFPPKITILIGVSAKAAGVEANVINLQTTISSRQPDT